MAESYLDYGYGKNLYKVGDGIQSAFPTLAASSPLPSGGSDLVSNPIYPDQLQSGEFIQHLTLAKDGAIMGGMTAYNTGTGFWLGYDLSDDLYKFAIGNITDYLIWDGSTLTISGTIAVTTGSIAGLTITATALTATSGGNSTIISSGATAFTAGPTGSPTFTVTQAGALTATSATITGDITATSGDIGGWVVVNGYIYNLQSGTPTAAPNDGLVLASGNEAIIIYEDTEKRAEIGYLSSGVYGLKVYASDGATVILEASDAQQKIGGFFFTDTTLATNATTNDANVLIDAANSLFRLGPTSGNYLTIDGANQKIESSNYVTGIAGSGFTLNSDLLEVGNIAARGVIRSAVFQKDVISSVGGNVIVVDSDVLATDMTALDSSSVIIEGNTTFDVGDIIRIKDGIDDEWMTVSSAASAPTYLVTRDEAGAYAANMNPTWKKGATVVNYRQSGDGFVYMTASETNAPYIQVGTHAGSPWSTITTRLRLGNLNGYLGYAADIYGLGVGSSGAGEANITIEPTNGIRMRSGTTTLFQIDNAGGATVAGWTLSTTTLANSTNIILDASNKAISINDATFGNLGVQIQYNAGTPRMHVGTTTKYLQFDGTNVNFTQGIIDGTSTVNGSTASNVQDRAEALFVDDYIFSGYFSDGFTESGAGTITREALSTTFRITVNTQSCTLNSGYLGTTTANAKFNWSDFVTLELVTTCKFSATTNQDAGWGFIKTGSSYGADATSTIRHVAFLIQDGTIYASNANGTTQTKTDVSSGITLTNMNVYQIIYSPGTNALFYINDVLVATHTTNLPASTASEEPVFKIYLQAQETAEKILSFKNSYLIRATI